MKRKGNTSVWTFLSEGVCKFGHKTVMAMSEWDVPYEFHLAQWETLPVI